LRGFAWDKEALEILRGNIIAILIEDLPKRKINLNAKT